MSSLLFSEFNCSGSAVHRFGQCDRFAKWWVQMLLCILDFITGYSLSLMRWYRSCVWEGEGWGEGEGNHCETFTKWLKCAMDIHVSFFLRQTSQWDRKWCGCDDKSSECTFFKYTDKKHSSKSNRASRSKTLAKWLGGGVMGEKLNSRTSVRRWFVAFSSKRLDDIQILLLLLIHSSFA